MPETKNQVRVALLLRTTLEILRDEGKSMWTRDVLAKVSERVEFTEFEREPATAAGQPRWEHHLERNTGEVTEIGWMTKIGGWSITEAGESALETFPDESLWTEFSRRLAEEQQRRKQENRQRAAVEQRTAEVVNLVTPGFWISRLDLAELIKVGPHVVENLLSRSEQAGSHRVLNDDGSLPPESLRTGRFPGSKLAERLASEGVEFDSRERASQRQRLTLDDLRENLGERMSQAPTKRAWLIRGSSVEGQNLVQVWLRKDSVSLAASGLRPIKPPVPMADLKSFVDEDYQHKSYSAREAKLAEFDAFCNRIRVGDFVLTAAQGKTYIGRIIGDPEYTHSSDQRSNLRRTVTWLNSSRPVSFNQLPDPLPAKLSDQSDVVDLTEDIAAVESMLRVLPRSS